ncbi:hypothetical protein L7F22_064836 [Adiantum nelumboides]|nr:hypothetical protein [Adiantum nelumboides]
MEPVPPRIQPPAKRLVLFIADGLRADKFFEMDASGRYRAPFLRSVIRNKGRWGVSHARPPTESRPGHVAIIAGFYEDPSAVTKGWKANPVEFDSVFNRSRHTFAFGSPDIVPMFCEELSNSHWKSYPHEFEDFATDASFLDEWSFERTRELLNQSKTDLELQKVLNGDQLVIFLHLLGCDTNGHAHRPFSTIYLNNVEVVDAGVKATVDLVEEMFPDQRTAYVFTADHGMSEKGSHGDGHPANTETPLVVWGAGVRQPSPASPEDYGDDEAKFVDQHEHHPPTPSGWGLGDIERVDVNQGDIAPLMSTLLGLPCPMNSVGSLPVPYLDLNEEDVAEAVFANAKQILNQFLQKSRLKQATSLNFKPFIPLMGYAKVLKEIRKLIEHKQYEAALQSAQELIGLSLAGLHYFQTYDWLFLMGTVTMGYLGWMVYVLLYVVRNYTSFVSHQFTAVSMSKAAPERNNSVRIFGAATLGVCSMILMVEHVPILYHCYLALAMLFWTEIFSDANFLCIIWSTVLSARMTFFLRLSLALGIAILILEVLVLSFFKREVYTGVFLVGGVVGAVVVSCNIQGLSMIPAFVWASCWFLSGFTLMPVQISDNILFVRILGHYGKSCSLSIKMFGVLSYGVLESPDRDSAGKAASLARVPVQDLKELCEQSEDCMGRLVWLQDQSSRYLPFTFLLMLDWPHPPLVVMWSIRDVAAIFGTPEDRLRTWAHEMVKGICKGFSVPWAKLTTSSICGDVVYQGCNGDFWHAGGSIEDLGLGDGQWHLQRIFSTLGMTISRADTVFGCRAYGTVGVMESVEVTAQQVGSGAVVLFLAFWSQWLDQSLPVDQALRSIVCGPFYKSRKRRKIFYVQAILVMMSTCMVWIATSIRAQKRGLPVSIQLINWFLAGIAIILPAFSSPEILGRLTSIFLGFAPPFLLLSIGYEALFYSALGLVLMSWILVEAALIHSPISTSHNDALLSFMDADFVSFTTSKGTRALRLADMTVALCFIVLINVAFFGTGNVASLASFEISSVYRFITIFSPFIMAALLLWKLLIPFILVTCAFSAVMKLLKLPRLGCYFIVMFFSDVMTIHFFFLVRNTGSWLEIGQTISHFGIMSAQVVFVLLLFAITNVFTRDIVVNPREQVKLT